MSGAGAGDRKNGPGRSGKDEKRSRRGDPEIDSEAEDSDEEEGLGVLAAGSDALSTWLFLSAVLTLSVPFSFLLYLCLPGLCFTSSSLFFLHAHLTIQLHAAAEWVKIDLNWPGAQLREECTWSGTACAYLSRSTRGTKNCGCIFASNCFPVAVSPL